jgi:ribosomal protein S18 acetylase RimI-like enzyme
LIDRDRLRREAEAPVPARAEDLGGVADDLAAAFADDPLFDWFLRPDGRRDAARRRFFRSLVRVVALKAGLVERPAHGGAAAVWLPFEAVGPIPLVDELRLAPTMLFVTGLARVSRMLALQSQIDRIHPMHRPHAYLSFFGVRPEAQGLGVGSRMLRVATGRLDAAAMPAYLETQTERNVALYRRHGFEVTREFRARPDAQRMWTMWREPN